MTSIIRKENSWSTNQATRASLLIDGENYFRALTEAIKSAKHKIFILSWDIDSRIQLLRDEEKQQTLSDVLCEALNNNPDLHVYILNWDWAALYSLEREWLPHRTTQWKNQDRLHFELDGECPMAASQHQKVVVIDDNIAFCGGIDLGKDRWDTSEHRPNDERRVNPDGSKYRPFHDIQWLVEGDIAKKLGSLARERWFRVTDEQIANCQETNSTAWPTSFQADFNDVNVNISLTFPEYEDYSAHHEVEQLYLDSINAAEEIIYLENQYLSSQSIAQALIKSLEQEQGPDVIIVLPKKTGGWLEQHTMDVLRARVTQQIKAADKFDRLRICYPHQDELGDEYISVHSKTSIIDNTLLRVGSSNLSNRSMGFDSECDLSIEASNEDESTKIKEIRERLLCEHLGIDSQQLTDLLDQHQRLTAIIDTRHQEARTLKSLDCAIPETVDQFVPEQPLIDPEKPVDAQSMINMLVPENQQKSTTKQWIGITSILVFIVALTLTWRYTPLADFLTENTISSFAEYVQSLPFSGVIITACIAIASLIAIPLTLLIVVSAAVFGAFWGGIFSLLGSLCGALMGFGIGQLVGKQLIEQMTGSAISRLSKRLAKKGIMSVVTFRIIPIAPFTVINLIAGASHIKFRDFLIGTIVGILPGIATLTIFAESLIQTIKDPSVEQILILLAVIVGVVVVTYTLKKIFKSKDNK